MNLSKKQKETLDLLYRNYENNSNIFLKDLQTLSGINRKFIGQYYKNRFD